MDLSTQLFGSFTIAEAGIALLVFAGSILIARGIGLFIRRLARTFDRESSITLAKTTSLFEAGIILVGLLIALSIIHISFATGIWNRLISIVPGILIFVIVFYLAYVVFALALDLFKSIILSSGASYLKEFDISRSAVHAAFFIVKFFIVIFFASIALRFAQVDLPLLDVVLMACIYASIAAFVGLAFYAFKDYAANLLLSTYISRNVIRVGQKVRYENQSGEVSAITSHGTIIRLESGYNAIIPNSRIVRDPIVVKRVESDLSGLDNLAREYTVTLSSDSGIATLQMLLSVFDIQKKRDEIKESAKAKDESPDAEIRALARAANTLSDLEVKGAFVEYNQLYHFRQEIKSWLTEEALIAVHYQGKDEKHARYRLIVGVEGDEFITLDTSKGGGTQVINASALEKSLITRENRKGYLVYAKRGSPAYWRITEKLFYGDVSAYQSISKSFERYLKKVLRKSRVVNNFLSPHVQNRIERKGEQ
jgi:small-conductance mechanosensitive channel